MSGKRERGAKRAAAFEHKEREEKDAPAAEPGPFDGLFQLPEMFRIVQDYAAPEDLARLSESSAIARARLLPVPPDAQLHEQRPASEVPAGYVDPNVAAVPYALRLLSQPHLERFLTDQLFPAERAVMQWAFEDPDMVLLLDRGRPIRRDKDGKVVYADVNSTDMLAVERGHPSNRSRRDVWDVHESEDERACPSNALWVRCFTRFLTEVAPKLNALFPALAALNEVPAAESVEFTDQVTERYANVVDHLRRSLPLSHSFTEKPRRTKRVTMFSNIFAPRPVPAPGSVRFERALRTCYADSFKAGEHSQQFNVHEFDFETFARVLIPAVLRIHRARLVFLHAWFPYTEVLQTWVYGPHGVQAPNTMYVMGHGSFDADVLTRHAARGLWTRATNGANVALGPFSISEAASSITTRLSWQYMYLEAYEFGCVKRSAGALPEPEPELPGWRLTANAIVRVAKAMCVTSNYRRLQNELMNARGEKTRSDAVRKNAEGIFGSDAMYWLDETEHAKAYGLRAPAEDDSEAAAAEGEEAGSFLAPRDSSSAAASSSFSSSSAAASSYTGSTPAFERDNVLQRLEDALHGLRIGKRRPVRG